MTIQARFERRDRDRTEVVLTGLPDAVIRESKTRLVAALEENGLHLPSGRLYVHLAPAGLRKSGEGLDLPLALGAAAACGHVRARRLAKTVFLGELGIDGHLHDVPGGLAAADTVRRVGFRYVVAPPLTAREAALLPCATVLAAANLAQVVRWVETGEGLAAPTPAPDSPVRVADSGGGLDAIRGQAAAKRALAVAAAGGHGLLFVGPPGTGKSLLARGLLRLLPAFEPDEQLDLIRVRSVARESREWHEWNGTLATERPFRAPHHTTSQAGLLGGGNPIVPGEITRAHRGILFLDELPEFRRDALEGLRQPLETGTMILARAAARLELPARFCLVAAMNPCPCGYRGHRIRRCRCSPFEVRRYRRRISGPLLDRIELRLDVPAPDLLSLARSTPPAESEDTLRAAIALALRRRSARQGARCNADLEADELDRHVPLADGLRNLIRGAGERRVLSARAVQSLRRVARTLADLGDHDAVTEQHLAEALALRAPILEED